MIFPHGESQVDGEKLTIENCLNDLASVEAHVQHCCPGLQSLFLIELRRVHQSDLSGDTPARGAKIFLGARR